MGASIGGIPAPGSTMNQLPQSQQSFQQFASMMNSMGQGMGNQQQSFGLGMPSSLNGMMTGDGNNNMSAASTTNMPPTRMANTSPFAAFGSATVGSGGGGGGGQQNQQGPHQHTHHHTHQQQPPTNPQNQPSTSKSDTSKLKQTLAQCLHMLVRLISMLLPQNFIPRIQQLVRDYLQERVTAQTLHDELHSLLKQEFSTIPQNLFNRVQRGELSYQDLITILPSAVRHEFAAIHKRGNREEMIQFYKTNALAKILAYLHQFDKSQRQEEQQRHIMLQQQRQQQQLQAANAVSAKGVSTKKSSTGIKKKKTPKTPTTKSSAKEKDKKKKATSKSSAAEASSSTARRSAGAPAVDSQKKQDDVELANHLNLFQMAGIDLRHEAKLLAQNRIHHFQQLEASSQREMQSELHGADLHQSLFFNVDTIHYRMSRIVRREGLNENVSRSVAAFMSLALEYRIRNFLDDAMSIANRRNLLDIPPAHPLIATPGTDHQRVQQLVQENNRTRLKVLEVTKMQDIDEEEDDMKIADEEEPSQGSSIMALAPQALENVQLGLRRGNAKKAKMKIQDCHFVIEQDRELRKYLSDYRNKYAR